VALWPNLLGNGQKSDKKVHPLPPGGSGIVGQGSKVRLILGSIRSTL